MDYRHHLRAVVAASAAPYGYTLTLWTAGAVTTHAQGLPSALDALLLLAGAVTGFAAVGAFAYGGINGVLAPGMRGEIRVWGGLHLRATAVESTELGLRIGTTLHARSAVKVN